MHARTYVSHDLYMKYFEDNNFNYYHYKPGSNIIIVYIANTSRTHAHACAHTDIYRRLLKENYSIDQM